MLTYHRVILFATLGLLLATAIGCVSEEQSEQLEQRIRQLEEEAAAMKEQVAESAGRMAEEARKIGEQAGRMGEAVGEQAAEMGERAGALTKKAALGPPTLVINLTAGKDDVHRAAMGLHLAEHGVAAEREVVIFFNVKSPELAVKDLPDSVGLDGQASIREMVAKLVDDGATALVCPMCAEVMGVEAEQLAPGLSMVSDRMQLFDHLGPNSVVFTY